MKYQSVTDGFSVSQKDYEAQDLAFAQGESKEMRNLHETQDLNRWRLNENNVKFA